MSASGNHPRPNSALVVEDDAGMATALTDLLMDAGYRPVTVASVRDAKACIDEAPPAVVLLDLSLADSFGTELLESLADAESAPPIVVVSAFRLASLIADRFGVELVTKPFEDTTLFSAMQRAIDRGGRPKLAHG